MFNDDYLRWRRLGLAAHTWANFKTHFNNAHTDWRDLSRMTAQQAGYQANNLGGFPDELSQAMDNLALAATTDKATVEMLSRQLEQAQQEIMRLLNDNRQMQNMILFRVQAGQPFAPAPAQQLSFPPLTWPTQPQPAKAPGGNQSTTKSKLDPNGYCWTHGYRVSIGHSSATCNKKALGHQDLATRLETMGGTDKGKPPK